MNRFEQGDLNPFYIYLFISFIMFQRIFSNYNLIPNFKKLRYNKIYYTEHVKEYYFAYYRKFLWSKIDPDSFA